jgi:hypothetical protein
MRKKLFITVLAVLLIAGPAMALTGVKVSDEKAADAAITTTSGIFYGIIVATDGTNACTVSIYDNASAASGTELIPTTVVTSSATDRVQRIPISPGVRYYNGIYVDITLGAGSVGYTVYFSSD